MSEEEVAIAAAGLAERMRQAEDARVQSRPGLRKTKRELRETERAERWEQLRKRSLGPPISGW